MKAAAAGEGSSGSPRPAGDPGEPYGTAKLRETSQGRPHETPDAVGVDRSIEDDQGHASATPGISPPALGEPRQDRRDRRRYHRMRRKVLRVRALLTVSKANNEQIWCFQCHSQRKKTLELHHRFYVKGSVLASHGGERADEAASHPKRFQLLCRSCHDQVHGRIGHRPVAGVVSGLTIVIPVILVDRRS